ncbi:MAG: GH92 family glycosyl hydrolase, partial [Bacteroidota bacterium]|nr:GH92 family glycosyl hydrolase [Bacteroidota bacterium]
FSLWDTFRATHPLFTILQQKRTNDFINTFLRQYEQGGRLPVWELAANETDCMIGYHSVPVIVDAFVKGIRDYDSELALKAMLNSANEDRYGLKYYKSLGYIPASEEGESVSKTLEYAYDDWCIAEFAKKMGDADTYHKFIERGQYWKNLYDPSTRFMRAKMGAGWFSPFDAREVNFNYTEANAWQYNFFVPHDVITMVDYMGGDKSFARFLDKLFTENASTTGRTQSDITGLIGQYAHGNEPSHHMAYLYSYVDEPWNTQKYVKRIMNELYSNRPDGLCGNEDCGQMSSWYVLSAMGFYSVTPGMDYYTLGSPMFDRVTINLENGNSFIIEANDNDSENVFVESVLLNGKKYDKSFINHSDIMNGGSFVFNMTDTPQKDCFKQSPVSVIDTSVIIPVPYIKEGAMTFKKSTEVVLECMSVDAEILYTIDGSDPIEEGVVYSRPIVVSSTTIVKAVAKQGNRISKEIKAHFALIPVGRSIKIEGEYANQYSAGGDNALIDGLRGGDDFKTGLWQGYQAQDVDVVIDLGDEKVYNKISIGFLQDMKSWIMMPEMVSFYISDDGKKFRKVGVEKNRVLLKEEGAVVHDFGIEKNMKSRYVKIVANNIGVLPTWHLGAGHDAWLFADEIIIE